MPYKNFVVIGSGTIGGPIAKALLAEGANVTVISRAGSTSVKDLPAGIKVVSVSLTDVPALAATFKEHNIEVVVSTVAQAALPEQHLLGDAAKQAGVKLFLPSEFGYSTIGLTEGELGLKSKFGEYLEEIGLPFTRIFDGGFITFIPWMLDISSGKVKILGKGDKKGTFTHPDDISGFVGYVLTHLAPAELENKIFRIQGEAASFLDIAAYYPTLPVEHIEEPFSGPDGEFKSFLQDHVNSGKGSVGYSAATGKELTGADAAGASNALWAGHKWRGIKEGLGL
ncbi:NAD(P)-binding protein [Athelia psychrophila]|uniref:NAD(P)-binding protein n=1 Tax=Athelia psychrophila TaxID=1759441 RepID=A0A166VEE5_9AGAM|nr:NAD(P)-binding protein [Fibularhizoctonia sp. CBS 109695]KZP32635.1 NAD(P)-binding protein [Fibularhizoctonia sp. CBS 109695]